MDRFGNFSFYMKGAETLSHLFPIISYISKIGALVRCAVDPLQRSDSALHEVDLR